MNQMSLEEIRGCINEFAQDLYIYVTSNRGIQHSEHAQPGDYAATLLCLWKPNECAICQTNHHHAIPYCHSHNAIPPIHGLDYHLRQVFSNINTSRAQYVGETLAAAGIVTDAGVQNPNAEMANAIRGCRLSNRWQLDQLDNIERFCGWINYEQPVKRLNDSITYIHEEVLGDPHGHFFIGI